MFESHTGDGSLHRAFTILIFNPRGEALIAKRSAGKRLWPSAWETSCSGHPLAGEDTVAKAERRLFEELGFETSLKTAGRFVYQARYQDEGAENELCYVLIGRYDGEVRPDPAEVSELRWTEVWELRAAIAAAPDDYAPWLTGALDVLAADSPACAPG